jgi:VWFA-related protein
MAASHLLWTSVFLFFFPAFAQQKTASTASAAGPANGRITLYVVANDKSGKPVAGLQQQDFTVLDNNQPQKIVSFEAVGPAKRADSDSELILILDAVNTSFTKVAFAREQLDKFLRKDGGRLARPVSIGIFTDAGLDMQQAPSIDGNALAAFLDQRETGLRTMNRTQGFYGAADRSQLSIRALGQLAEREMQRPGRKLVIWISPGWPLLSGPHVDLTYKEQQNIFSTIVQVSTQLREAGIALYSVDPLGTSDQIGREFYYEQFLKPVKSPKQVYLGDLALQVLAVHSGGRVLNSNNDIAFEIERCAQDASAYYVLSFDSPPADGANDYNAIEVKIDQPQLKAQTLSGYYAQPVRPHIP